MCRLLAYLGDPVQLERLLYDPQHSLVVQSYQPREMTSGLLNADGFGIGWYAAPTPTTVKSAESAPPADKSAESAPPADDPYIYRHTLPIWNDVNLPSLSRYIRSPCIMANVRSATPGLAVDLSNCQPFQQRSLLAIHNGYIDRFRQTLYRPIRQHLSDAAYQSIHGTTDSEHMFALLLDAYAQTQDLAQAMKQMLHTLLKLASQYHTDFSANFVISDGKTLVAARFANRDPVPSLYWLQNDPSFPNSILIASEPFFAGNWRPFADRSFLVTSYGARSSSLDLQFESLEVSSSS
jgi:ergothioneine biosynthesis protein EgtC